MEPKTQYSTWWNSCDFCMAPIGVQNFHSGLKVYILHYQSESHQLFAILHKQNSSVCSSTLHTDTKPTANFNRDSAHCNQIRLFARKTFQDASVLGFILGFIFGIILGFRIFYIAIEPIYWAKPNTIQYNTVVAAENPIYTVQYIGFQK